MITIYHNQEFLDEKDLSVIPPTNVNLANVVCYTQFDVKEFEDAMPSNHLQQ